MEIQGVPEEYQATAWQQVSASADFGRPYPVDLPATPS
jgi:hypothetical protein